jgi:hypothetical protein
MEQLSGGPPAIPPDPATSGPRPILGPAPEDPRRRLAELLARLLARRWFRERQAPRPGPDDPDDPAAGRSPPEASVR